MYTFGGYIGIWYSCWIPMYPECMVFGTYIGNARVRAFPMYYYSSFSRRYIGIEISKPIPMYEGPNLAIIYIGMGQHKSFPMYRLKLPKQNTSEFRVFIQSRCIQIISREYTRILSQYIPAQAGKTSKIHRNPSIFIHRVNVKLPLSVFRLQ